jgi:hypothetical protein
VLKNLSVKWSAFLFAGRHFGYPDLAICGFS